MIKRLILLGILIFCCLLGCSSDSPSGGGGTPAPPGPAVEFNDAWTAIYDSFITEYETAYHSLEFFVPLAAEALADTSSGPAPATLSSAANCSPYMTSGITYEFWGNRYHPVVNTGAPENGVRFTLYELDQAGQVVLSSPIGFIVLECFGSIGSYSVKVEIGGETKLYFFAGNDGGDSWSVDGWMMDSDSEYVDLSGGVRVSDLSHFFTLYAEARGYRLQYAQSDIQSINSRQVNLIAYEVVSERHFLKVLHATVLYANLSGTIDSGGIVEIEHLPEFSPRLTGCVSGTLNNPEFESLMRSKCKYTAGGIEIKPASRQDLEAIRNTYITAYDLFLKMRGLLFLGVSEG